MTGPNKKIHEGYGPSGSSPFKVVPCLHENLAGVVSRTKDEQRHVVVESRDRQIKNNPLKDKWVQDNPQLQGFYDGVAEEQVNLNRARKNRKG